MSSDIVSIGGAALSVVDLALIGLSYNSLNKRVTSLEKSSGSLGSGSAVGRSDLESRVLALENANEVLLQRLHCYNDLFTKILTKFREDETLNVSVARSLAGSDTGSRSPPRITSIRRRVGESILARKEPFVDDMDDGEAADAVAGDGEAEAVAPDVVDEARFSFLKD